MKKLWGFVNFVGLLIAAAGFITHSAVLIVLGIAVCLLGEWQKSRVSEAVSVPSRQRSVRYIRHLLPGRQSVRAR